MKSVFSTSERRIEILNTLSESQKPISATSLSAKFHVSRQIIVGDIAILRAEDNKIFATPRGYILEKEQKVKTKIIACCHLGLDNMKKELYTIVDNGCGAIDVIVEHSVYGQITGQLRILSRRDVDEFLSEFEKNSSSPLSSLTGGIHLHTISYPDDSAFEHLIADLKSQKILLNKEQK